MLADAETFEATRKRRDEVLVFLNGRLTPELYARVEQQLRGCHLVTQASGHETRKESL